MEIKLGFIVDIVLIMVAIVVITLACAFVFGNSPITFIVFVTSPFLFVGIDYLIREKCK